MTHYDYAVQVWVQNGIVVPCSHPSWMRRNGIPCCQAWTHQGRPIRDVRAELLVSDAR